MNHITRLAAGLGAIFAVLLAALPASAQGAEGEGKPICGERFVSLSVLLKQIRSIPGARIVSEDAFYLAIQDPKSQTIWTFTGQANPAMPSVICRRPVAGEDGQLTLHMEVRCGATKTNCAALLDAFKKLNAQMVERMRKASQ